MDINNGRFSWRKFQASFQRVAFGVIAGVLIFALGIEVGNGNIRFRSGSMHSMATGLPDNLDYSTVEKVYDTLRQDYDGQVTTAQLLAGLKKGLANATGDPHTEFFTAKEAKQFNNELNNTFSGIGAELGEDGDGNLLVISPIKGFPAAKAGLQPKDIITDINGTSTGGMSVTEAVNRIRGKSGTKVKLEIVRDHAKTLALTITRADIKLPSVTTKILDGNIGYMQISTFAKDTSDLAQKAANQFKDRHVNGIVLDLRGNPGGIVDAAVNVSSLWLPEGKTIMQEKRGGTVVNTYTATGDNRLQGIPTVVLIDGGSASASEITAGALHDNGVARLIGVKSYGKGSVQQVEDFSDGSELKVTIARWYRPNGENIDKKGIKPDQTVKLSDQDIKNKNDIQLKAAEAYLKK